MNRRYTVLICILLVQIIEIHLKQILASKGICGLTEPGGLRGFLASRVSLGYCSITVYPKMF